jgi:sec-independent protein translocase protein TatB
VKSDINREMETAELSKVKSEFENAAQSFKQDIESKAAETDRELRDVETEIDRQLREGEAAVKSPVEAASEAIAPSPQLELGIEEPPQPPAKAQQAAP